MSTLRCHACGAPCFVHYCYNCGTSDPGAAEPQKVAARLARECATKDEQLAVQDKELAALRQRVHVAPTCKRLSWVTAVWNRMLRVWR